MKLENLELKNPSLSWKVILIMMTSVKIIQRQSLFSNLNGKFLTIDFPTSNFLTSPFYQPHIPNPRVPKFLLFFPTSFKTTQLKRKLSNYIKLACKLFVLYENLEKENFEK